jgi:hypothetical protein
MQKLPGLYLILILLSCRQPAALTDSEKATITDSIHQTLRNYLNDIKRSGLMAEFKYLDHSPDFFWVPPGYAGAISYDSVAAILKKSAPKYKLVENSFDTLHIVPLNKELATYAGRLQSAMTDSSGVTRHFSLLETGVMIKRADGWKLLNGHTSIANP